LPIVTRDERLGRVVSQSNLKETASALARERRALLIAAGVIGAALDSHEWNPKGGLDIV
jgi:hypothetical protein